VRPDSQQRHPSSQYLGICYALISYLRLSKINNPEYFGIDLSSNESWERLEGLMTRLVEGFSLGKA